MMPAAVVCGMAGPATLPPPPPRPCGTSHRRRHRRAHGGRQQQHQAQALASGGGGGATAIQFRTTPSSSTPSSISSSGGGAGRGGEAKGEATSSAASFGALCVPGPGAHQQAQTEKMIRDFKTMPCGLEGNMSSHDHRCCPFYHSERDRRRPVRLEQGAGVVYCAEPCSDQFDDLRQCPRGDACLLCHSTAELLYHPDFFRKRLCHQAKRCPRGRFCAFAHSRQELLVPHFNEPDESQPTEDFIAYKFKTQWCPIGGPHDWENCVYAHTYRDWRRTPSLGYSSRPCPQWVQSVMSGMPEMTYADRCPRGMGCPLAHGAKEQLYHPQFYKTSPCSEGNCKRGSLCAFTHGGYDTRRPKPEEPIPLSVREPIIQAEMLLCQNQPTYWNPPRYHALEEPPRAGVGEKAAGGGLLVAVGEGSSAAGRGASSLLRSRRGSRQLRLAALSLSAAAASTADAGVAGPEGEAASDGSGVGGAWVSAEDTDAAVAAATALLGAGVGTGGEGLLAGGAQPSGTGAATMPPYVYQWVPLSESSSQLVPPPVGYDALCSPSVEPWGMPLGYAPVVWGASLPPCFLTLPNSAQLALEDVSPATAAGDQDGSCSPAVESAEGVTCPPCQPFRLWEQDISPVSALGDLPSLEDLLARQQNYYLRKGMRTPSSLGSPPLSVAPTEAPTPRGGVEGASPDEGSVYGSSDDAACREVPSDCWATQVLGGPGCFLDVSASTGPDGGIVEDELQEAPRPSSPCAATSPMKLKVPPSP